ncbi:hypothetical protein LJC01_00650 [Clostridiaceae bacterium OttesenSCG-928-D20]|nr:hypothetical protein [Clostridiaceae bacterium OttesenSCG-928-D20]
MNNFDDLLTNTPAETSKQLSPEDYNAKKVRKGTTKSLGTFGGEEEQGSEVDTRHKASVTEHSLRRQDEA